MAVGNECEDIETLPLLIGAFRCRDTKLHARFCQLPNNNNNNNNSKGQANI